MKNALTAVGDFIEAAGNMVFSLLVILILTFPPLVWINNRLSGRSGVLWVLVAIVFAIVLPAAMELFAGSAMNVIDRIRDGRLLRPVLQPLRSVSAALAVYGVFKVEYAIVHGLPAPEGGGWVGLVWQFLTAF